MTTIDTSAVEQLMKQVHPDRRDEAVRAIIDLFTARSDLALPRDELKERILDASLDEWDIFVRTRNCLQVRGGYPSMRSVITKSSGELMRLHGFGDKCLNDLLGVLSEYHLHLGMEPWEFARWYARDDVPAFRPLKPRR